MKKGILTFAVFALASVSAFAATIVVPGGSTLIASWSFDAVATVNTGTTPTFSTGSATADLGTQTGGSSATALHASSSTVYSNPSGNGSAKALSSNTWALGDYYQFTVSTLGFTNINVIFGAVGSATGPRDFKLTYSTDGTSFNDVQTYTLLSSPTWSTTATSFQPTETYAFDLSSITAVNNLSSLIFRLVTASTTAINGSGVATSGTSRVDDFTVSSGPVSLTAAPEPSTLVSLVGGLGLLCGFRRLRSRLSRVDAE